LRDVTAALIPGDHVFLEGPAASGKTSLLKLLAGLLRPTSGTLLWDETDVWSMQRETLQARQAAIGFVFQTDALFDSQTALENVRLPLLNRGVPFAEANERAAASLERLGIAHAASQLPRTLSGGMRKRCGLARALVARPEVLLVDDPLAGLDPDTADQVSAYIEESARGKILVVAAPEKIGRVQFTGHWSINGGQLTAGGASQEAGVSP
jgi:phospholipid/cholesterol/gamma-HCH transport system ATP-binding protein